MPPPVEEPVQAPGNPLGGNEETVQMENEEAGVGSTGQGGTTVAGTETGGGSPTI